jgi:hypothetical protein
MIPAKADPDKQKEFLEQEIQPRLDEAQAGKRVVLFVDAAHFVLAPFLGFLSSVVRVFIQAPSGRQRFNVLDALNAITHELITITNDAYINAESVCALLEKIANLLSEYRSLFFWIMHVTKNALWSEKKQKVLILNCAFCHPIRPISI